MRSILVSLMILMFATMISCAQSNNNEKADKRAAVITFEAEEHDFGTIEQGGNGTFEFIFKNTGKTPLVINHVGSSCGCTVPEWTRDPIAKRKSGKIKVTYDTQRLGSFTKTITVNSNAANNPVVLKIKGVVVMKGNAPK